MRPTYIRTQCKYGMFTVHHHDGNTWAEVDGKIYHWNPDASSGYPGCIQHSGNFLHGTEYRGPVRGGGDWVQYPHLEHGHVVTTAGLGFGANGYPSGPEVEQALDGRSYLKWERTNPEGGHNNEWIEWPCNEG